MTEPLRAADHEARSRIADPLAARKAFFVLISSALLLTLQNYTCLLRYLDNNLTVLARLGLIQNPDQLRALLVGQDSRPSLLGLAWWAVGSFLCYFVAPALLIRLVLHEKLADHGFKLRGALADLWIYAAFFGGMIPLVLLASRNEAFQRMYPFYDPTYPLGGDFLLWEVLYALQFLATEFFFRGYLIHGTRERLGALCIPVMTIPYCMIHFSKPWPETVGSVVAGLVLGLMSLKNRSIMMGVILHIGVAMSMDLASLWRRGFFGW